MTAPTAPKLTLPMLVRGGHRSVREMLTIKREDISAESLLACSTLNIEMLAAVTDHMPPSWQGKGPAHAGLVHDHTRFWTVIQVPLVMVPADTPLTFESEVNKANHQKRLDGFYPAVSTRSVNVYAPTGLPRARKYDKMVCVEVSRVPYWYDGGSTLFFDCALDDLAELVITACEDYHDRVLDNLLESGAWLSKGLL